MTELTYECVVKLELDVQEVVEIWIPMEEWVDIEWSSGLIAMVSWFDDRKSVRWKDIS
jgi:hypothetical protein